MIAELELTFQPRPIQRFNTEHFQQTEEGHFVQGMYMREAVHVPRMMANEQLHTNEGYIILLAKMMNHWRLGGASGVRQLLYPGAIDMPGYLPDERIGFPARIYESDDSTEQEI
jgi:hypothetical protein